jgi:protocatechuate 3,4-dioxygenase beta subunit
MEKANSPGWILSRRGVLGLFGAGMLAGGMPVRAQTVQPSRVCVATPEQTEGPYFVDERLLRSDIRSDQSDGQLREGAPMILRLAVASVEAGECRPLTGAIVDLWQCDATGAYSDVSDPGGSTEGRKFLRGYQVTDASGHVQFVTIYPGAYPGRAVHIHVKVRTHPASPRAHELTSQLYFNDALTDRVHAQQPYAGSARRRVRNESDSIFRRAGGSRLLLPVVAQGGGYVASFGIGLQLS